MQALQKAAQGLARHMRPPKPRKQGVKWRKLRLRQRRQGQLKGICLQEMAWTQAHFNVCCHATQARHAFSRNRQRLHHGIGREHGAGLNRVVLGPPAGTPGNFKHTAPTQRLSQPGFHGRQISSLALWFFVDPIVFTGPGCVVILHACLSRQLHVSELMLGASAQRLSPPATHFKLPTISRGTTHWSNCSPVTWPLAMAASRRLLPSLCAFLAM